jgi:hypothetical protein
MKKLAEANAAAEIAAFEKMKVHTKTRTADNSAFTEPAVNRRRERGAERI